MPTLRPKHLLNFATLVVTSLACVGPAPAATGPGWRGLPSIAAIRVVRADGDTAVGTGFLGVREGMLVTALHVVRNAAHVTATFADGEVFDCPGLVDKDERRNVALVRIKSFGRPMLALGAREPAVGDTVRCPAVKDGAFGVVRATLTEVTVMNGVKLYRLSGDIPAGNSGAPIVDGRGDVVGIHVSGTLAGKDVEMALPSSYVLALEPSLPVQPWVQAAPQAATSPANVPVDATLASALVMVHDLTAVHLTLSQNLYSITRYGQLRGMDFYRLQSDVDNQLSQLAWLKTDDPLRTRLIQATGQLLARQKTALEYEGTCAALNKDTPPSKHVPQAEDAARRAHGVLAAIPDMVQTLQPDFRRLAAESPAFHDTLPSEMRYYLGIEKRKSRVVLGALVSARDPFYILGFEGGQLAGKIGLHGGDRIVSAGGRGFTAAGDIEDFKQVLENNAGQWLEVVVQRGGSLKTLRVKVPADLLEHYAALP